MTVFRRRFLVSASIALPGLVCAGLAGIGTANATPPGDALLDSLKEKGRQGLCPYCGKTHSAAEHVN